MQCFLGVEVAVQINILVSNVFKVQKTAQINEWRLVLMNYNRNKKYFTSGKVGLIIGVVLLLFALGSLAGGEILWALIWGAAGAAAIYFLYIASQISDREIDEVCGKSIGNIKAEALLKLGIDADEVTEAEPISVHGYSFGGGGMSKLGKDGAWRSSQYSATVFFFSNDQVHCYTRKFSIIDPDNFETTEEYFYRDIVAVKVEQGSIYVDGGKGSQKGSQKVSYDFFKLTTSGGTSIEAVFRKKDSDLINRSITAMRNLLKNKKQAMS